MTTLTACESIKVSWPMALNKLMADEKERS